MSTRPEASSFEEIKTRWELKNAWDRVQSPGSVPGAGTRTAPVLAEAMTLEQHERLWGRHRSLQKLSAECSRYSELMKWFKTRNPSSKELAWLSEHEKACRGHLHSERALEVELGVPSGALREGAPEYGLPDPETEGDDIVRAMQRRRTRSKLRLVKGGAR